MRECLFRAQRTEAGCHFCLKDGRNIRPGAPILTLHFWNDHIPVIGGEGPTIGWAQRFRKALDLSLAELARFLRERPDFDAIVAIRIEMGIGDAAANERSVRFLGRFGFERAPPADCRPARYLRRLGDNAMTLLLILAFNPNAAHGSILRRERAVVYLARATLDRSYPARRDP